MPMPPHIEVIAVLLVIAAAVVGIGGMAAAWRFGVTDRRGRIPALIALAALGLGAGFLGSTMQGSTLQVGGSSGPDGLDAATAAATSGGGTTGGVALPVGAVIGLLLLALLLVRGATLVRAPIGVLIPAAGWLVMLSVLMYGSQKGDVVLANSGSAQLFLFGGLLLAAGIAFATQFQQLKEQVRTQQQVPSPEK